MLRYTRIFPYQADMRSIGCSGWTDVQTTLTHLYTYSLFLALSLSLTYLLLWEYIGNAPCGLTRGQGTSTYI
jgi:hypothetical protein